MDRTVGIWPGCLGLWTREAKVLVKVLHMRRVPTPEAMSPHPELVGNPKAYNSSPYPGYLLMMELLLPASSRLWSWPTPDRRKTKLYSLKIQPKGLEQMYFIVLGS